MTSFRHFSQDMALWRGFKGRCPNCGKGKLFKSFLKPVNQGDVWRKTRPDTCRRRTDMGDNSGRGLMLSSAFFEQRFTQMADNRFSSDRPFLDYSWAPAAHGGTIHSIDLACNGLRWDAIDDNMARATLTDGDVQVAMTF